jgi:hypothetical protein
MRLSENTDKLFRALFEIQKNVTVKKTSVNPHHKSKYANLETLLDASIPEMENRGLLAQQTLDDENVNPGQVLIITRIIHIESGQWVESRLRMDARQATPQDLGSAITYARRYSLMTTLGLNAEDDDANAAQGYKKPELKPYAPKPNDFDRQKAQQVANQILAFQKQYGYSNDEILRVGGIGSLKKLRDAGEFGRLQQALVKLQKSAPVGVAQ